MGIHCLCPRTDFTFRPERFALEKSFLDFRKQSSILKIETMFGKDDLLTDAQLHELLKDNGYTLAVLKGDQVVFPTLRREG